MSRISTALLLAALLGTGCEKPSVPLFELRPDAGVTFSNELGYADEFNVYRYRNFYNGGGVALGDVSGDGLLDLFFTSNQGRNRLYLNRGHWVFEDVTDAAGVAGTRAWSTGASMADVNGDGWLDLYVCNSGIVAGDDRRNELYINQGDGTFQEQAKAYGLDDAGWSIHGSFLDYDRDGDLDLYLVNNSFRSIQDFDLSESSRHRRHQAGGDRLFENLGGTFADVSAKAGIYGSEIGFGLGVSVGDVNRDGWPDLYLSNDFFERDYLYLNNTDGTFTEMLESSIKSVSAAAMGADIADLNGDGFVDIFVTDMLPREEVRLKTVTSFDSWARYQNYVRDDYYHQFTRNTLQVNLGRAPHARVHFTEAGRFAGVAASDWSWGALIADFDHDGQRDVFVANGVYQDLTNADFLVEVSKEETVQALVDRQRVDWAALIAMIPSNPIPNHMFAGDGTLRFSEVTARWGLDAPGFSNGSAYGDLDNDGDLDLVINNLHQPASLYENHTVEHYPGRAWLQLSLRGHAANTFGVGTQVTAWHAQRAWHVEQQPVRGYQSSVDPIVHLGLGEGVETLDSLEVRWPGGGISRVYELATRQRITLWETDGAGRRQAPRPAAPPWMTPVSPETLGLHWRHRENSHSDFDQQPLLFHMRSTEGPGICAGDANGDGHMDLYLGGAKGQPGSLWLQDGRGAFTSSLQPALVQDSTSEDTDCLWFDSDGDGDEDLLVASGGSELPSSSSALMDRLYQNSGDARLTRRTEFHVPGRHGFEPTGAIAAADVDGDGDLDLFAGTRLRPFAYGFPSDGHLLFNDGTGTFSEATDERAATLRDLGMITDAAWGDLDGDRDADLVVVGEWMPVTILFNDHGTLVPAAAGHSAAGWWQSVHLADLDLDGDLDIIAGNHGLNSRFRASPDAPVTLWTSDFDRNGRVEQILSLTKEGVPYPMALRHDLVEQIPYLVRPFPTFASFAGAAVHDIFSAAQLADAVVLQVTELRSMVLMNDGQGGFMPVELPVEAQLTPLYAALAADVNQDNAVEILLGGNLYEAKPEVGRYDASYGTVLREDRGAVPWKQSGFWVDGAIRAFLPVQVQGQNLLVVALNNDSLKVFSYGR